MKRLWIRTAVAFLCIASIWACQKEEGIQTDLTNVDDQSLTERARNPSVSGHVEIDSLDENGRYQQYSFTAVMKKDGSVRGELHLFDTYNDSTRLVAHGNVECFTIQDDGKTAWLGGVVERGMLDSTNLVGAEAYWTVVDNGEGARSDPDEATEIAYGFDGILTQDHCEEGLGTFVYSGPILRSNVQVKP